MTDVATLCPVCEHARPADPQECKYDKFWDDGSVTRAHTRERIDANERELEAARTEMRAGPVGLRRSCTPIRDGTPPSGETTLPSTDVVCIVDRTGTAEEFAQRTNILRDLLHLVEQFGERFRVALIECCDHRYAAAVVDEPCVLVHELDTPEKALIVVAQWQPLAGHNDLGAPIEDALAALKAVEWRDGSRRVLVTLGARAPHPRRQTLDKEELEKEPWLNCCPFGHDWESLLADAKKDLDLHCAAVRAPRTGNELSRLALRREQAWRALGVDARRDPKDVLAEVLGLTAPASAGGAG